MFSDRSYVIETVSVLSLSGDQIKDIVEKVQNGGGVSITVKEQNKNKIYKVVYVETSGRDVYGIIYTSGVDTYKAVYNDTTKDVDISSVSSQGGMYPATHDRLGGIKVGQNLNITEEGVLSVETTNDAEADNTKPITSAGTHMILGNIDALLKLI